MGKMICLIDLSKPVSGQWIDIGRPQQRFVRTYKCEDGHEVHVRAHTDLTDGLPTTKTPPIPTGLIYCKICMGLDPEHSPEGECPNCGGTKQVPIYGKVPRDLIGINAYGICKICG